jgi:tRNA threonylcarbamoyladenosine dehydratase
MSPLLHMFGKTEALLGREALDRLHQSRVAVLGLGGVGSFAVEALARSGIEHLILVDADRVNATNLNRQLIATEASLGLLKVDAMRQRVLEINPDASVVTRAVFYQPGDFDWVVGSEIDYVIDAMDTVSAKVDLVVQSQTRSIPIISCMGTANKLDPSELSISDISQTSVCPLCRAVRQGLRRHGVHHAKVVYSREKPFTSHFEPGINELGSVAFVPSVAGLIMAGEVIKTLAHNT